ncbi:MAG: 4a-hydroxytetrahydrobiopterin dehydratase [Candidatus Eremiobacteraeota bacterium]|nr:4a-hydroxytetrahydrobiopterin dehydratase [Candidatus Eremiobacteraeota bacterium]
MSGLAEKTCVPCRGGIPPLRPDEIAPLLGQLNGDWEVVENHHLRKTYRFKNFKEALAFTNRVGELAESIGHHPDIYLAWGKVRLEIWTHKIDGLAEADFIFAAKCDRVLSL